MPSAVFLPATGARRSILPYHNVTTTAADNRLLSQLKATEYWRLKPDLEQVPRVFNSIIFGPNAPIDYVYLPESSDQGADEFHSRLLNRPGRL